jgi:hypothetical protein
MTSVHNKPGSSTAWRQSLVNGGVIGSNYSARPEKAGNVPDGGTLWEFQGNIAVWNAVMREDRYLTHRRNEFITS